MLRTLRQLVQDIAKERDIQQSTIDQYDRSSRYFGDFIGKDASPQDLLESRVNLWTASLQEKYGSTTVKNYLRGLLAVWNYAASLELVSEYQRARIRKPKVLRKVVSAWRPETVRAIEAAAMGLPGTILNGCPVSVYFTAYVLVAADTMFRPSDMRLIEWDSIQGDLATIIQHKTGCQVTRPLRQKTIDALKSLRPWKKTGRIFWLGKGGHRFHENKLRKAAGIFEPGKALGKLRHAGATQTARNHGMAAATASLGHLPGSVVAAISYVAPDQSAVPGPWADAS